MGHRLPSCQDKDWCSQNQFTGDLAVYTGTPKDAAGWIVPPGTCYGVGCLCESELALELGVCVCEIHLNVQILQNKRQSELQIPAPCHTCPLVPKSPARVHLTLC